MSNNDDDIPPPEWQEMIEEGLLVPTGEYRRARNGVMQPVYRLRDGLSSPSTWSSDTH